MTTFAAGLETPGAPAKDPLAPTGVTVIPAPPTEPCPIAQPAAISTDQPIEQQLAQARAQEKNIEAALASCDARIERLNTRLAALRSRIQTVHSDLAAQRREIGLLARGIYRQPDSVLVALVSSQNLGDFMTSVADVASAGRRGEEIRQRMQQELDGLQQTESLVAGAESQQQQVRLQIETGVSALQATSAQLEAAIAAAAAAAAAANLPAPFAASPGVEAIKQLIRDAFAPLGSGAVDWALRVAMCESGYNPQAVNPYSGTEGLFQFMPSTWRGTPYGNQSPFDPRANAYAAAWLYGRDGPSQWQCR